MARRTPRTNPKLAVAYIRVSTEDQSLGPDVQLEQIKRWAATHGVELASVHRDQGVSGGAAIDRRPGLMEALQALDATAAGVLLVSKRCRLARDVVVAAAVERLAESKGARIVSADGAGNGDGPEGMLLRGLVDLFAQYERAMIKSRTRAALAVKRARGERTGEVPLGSAVIYEADGRGRLVAHEAEQRALMRIIELRAMGLSIRAVAERLNVERVPARGKRWHATSVARALARAELATGDTASAA